MAYKYYAQLHTSDGSYDNNGRYHLLDFVCVDESMTQPTGNNYVHIGGGPDCAAQVLADTLFADAGITFESCCMYVWNETTGKLEECDYTDDYLIGAIRGWRDHCIQKTDYKALPDVQALMTAQEITDINNFRQSLRDITSGIPDRETKIKLAKRDPAEWPVEP